MADRSKIEGPKTAGKGIGERLGECEAHARGQDIQQATLIKNKARFANKVKHKAVALNKGVLPTLICYSCAAVSGAG